MQNNPAENIKEVYRILAEIFGNRKSSVTDPVSEVLEEYKLNFRRLINFTAGMLVASVFNNRTDTETIAAVLKEAKIKEENK